MIDKKFNKEEYVAKGHSFRVDFEKIEVEKFANIILWLVNNKSAKICGLSDVTTYDGTNIISLVFENEDKEKCIELCNYIIKSNVLEEKFTLEHTGEVEIVTVWQDYLEECGIVKNGMDAFVKGTY